MFVTQQIVLEEIVCGTCGITHAVPADWIKNRRAEKGDIHCPNGCCRTWRESAISPRQFNHQNYAGGTFRKITSLVEVEKAGCVLN